MYHQPRRAEMEIQNDHHLLAEFLDLDQSGQVQAEYIWIGGSGQDLRGKTRTLAKAPWHVSDLPEWNYDGSSTGQAPGHNSEVILKPQAIFRDPFRRGPNILVMCDTYEPNGTPIPTNTRHPANLVMERAKEHEPWFGIEQEYTLFAADKITPLGWPQGGYPLPQGPYYCGVGYDKAFGRSLVETHYRACLYAGVKISGVNAEVMPGQWEYQIGPCTGIEAGDHLWVSRYIMHRLAERFGVIVSFHPKPITDGDCNGAGAHTNVSTRATRAEGGLSTIYAHVEKLSKKHNEHIAVYGEHNTLRLTGKHETAHITQFRAGVADRGASIRIPSLVEKEGKGYYEDRRPASNIDPYLVTARIIKTTCLDE